MTGSSRAWYPVPVLQTCSVVGGWRGGSNAWGTRVVGISSARAAVWIVSQVGSVDTAARLAHHHAPAPPPIATMAAEDDTTTTGVKRDREDDHGDAAAPSAKEPRVEGEGGITATDADADATGGGGSNAPGATDDAEVPSEANADGNGADARTEGQPSAVDQLAEALEMLAPVVTKRLDQLHASGLVSEDEIDAHTLLLLGEFTPKVAVEIIDTMTKENLEVGQAVPCRRRPSSSGPPRRSRPSGPPGHRGKELAPPPFFAPLSPWPTAGQSAIFFFLFFENRLSSPPPSAFLLQGVENKSAYMQEVMIRFKGASATAATAPAAAYDGAAGYPQAGAEAPAVHVQVPGPPAAAGEPIRLGTGQVLGASLSVALQQLWASGVVAQGQIDERMLEYLAGMPEHQSVGAVEELSRANLDGIRNISAYFKTICRRHQGPAAGGGGGYGQQGGGFQGGGMSGPAPPEAFFEIQRHYQMGVITQPVAMRLEQFFMDTGASLDKGAWEIMLQLNEMSAMAAIEEVHGACRSDRPVRNPSAYFTGIARKHLAGTAHMPPPGGGYGGYPGGGGYGGGGGFGGGGGGRGGPPVDDAQLQQQLPPVVFQRVCDAVNRGRFDRNALDQRAVQTFAQLDEASACSVIDEIEQTDLGRIRNFAGYFMGICNKHLRGGGPPPPRY